MEDIAYYHRVLFYISLSTKNVLKYKEDFFLLKKIRLPTDYSPIYSDEMTARVDKEGS